jgi:EmrB/QacA subfamily drug resistance transporter
MDRDEVAEGKRKSPRLWIILATVIVGTFLGRLDQTIVNLALPKIIGDFNVTVAQAGWIATAYIIANAIFVPIWGRLGDMIGRKKVYVIGFIGFIVGSVLAGLAWNLPSLVAFRVIQAVAGSADYPTAMSIISSSFPEEKKRGQALGIWSASFAAAAVFGPLIGGPLIDAFGWRSVFLVNLPVGIVGLAMAWAFIEESVSSASKKFDVAGALVLGVALSALVLVLEKGLDWGWTSWQSLLSYALVVAFGFVFVRIERNHPAPIVDLKFFKIPAFVHTLVNNFIVFMGMMGSIFLVPVFAQTFLGLDATQTGYLFMPMAAGMMFAAPLGGKLAGRVQPSYVIAASTAVAALGIYFLSWLDPRSTSIDIIIPMFVMAFGMGFGMAQRTNIIASVVPPREIGIASSVLALARNIAGAFGIAIFGTILNNRTESNLIDIANGTIIRNPSLTGVVTTLAVLKAQVDAYGTVYLVSALVLLVGAIGAFWIKAPKGSAAEQVLVVD